MSEIYEGATPEFDNIIIQETKIGLTISQNGSELFYFNTEKNVDITNVDVKVITSAYTISGGIIWTEKNSYLFSIGSVKKYNGLTSSGKYQHSVLVKMIDSPIVTCSQKEKPNLFLRFYIYYDFEGISKRIIADTTKPENKSLGQDKGEYIKYYSKTYRDRALLPYSIRLDSIYRPFFCNSVLFLFDGNSINNQNILTQEEYKNISANTYCKFYFSIANGCTLRDKDYPIYRIGDINLKISNIDKGGIEDKESVYNFTIKDNFRIFSEIEDFHVLDNEKNTHIETRKNLLKDAHIRGIREAGINDSLNDFTHSGGQTINGGIFLPQVDKNDYFKVKHDYINSFIPDNITYTKNDKKVDVYDIYSAQKFNTKQPLNIELSVNDASPDDINFKTNEIKCEYLTFPEKVEISASSMYNILKLYYNSHNNDITYIHCNIGHLKKIYEILGKMNVNDNISETEVNDDIFNYLNFKLKDQQIVFNNYEPNEKFYWTILPEKPEYILAIYHGGYENDEGVWKYIKHTNKLLIMRLYKL